MSKQSNKLPITKKQLEILHFLFQFRFLTTNTLQHLLNHKNPTRIQQWLLDLTKEEYINQFYDRTTLIGRTKSAVYCLNKKARKILKTQDDCDPYVLSQIYREKTRSEEFQNHCCYIAEMYLQLQKLHDGKDGRLKMSFFTRSELIPYKHFPQPLPDAFITVEEKDKKTHYFLEVFDLDIPKRPVKERIRRYIQCEQGDWNEKTNDTKFPIILFIVRNRLKQRNMKKLIQMVRDEEYSDLPFYITNKEEIKEKGMGNIQWQKVERE